MTRRRTGPGPLVSARGIEIGHIFQLGRKYTDAFTADVLGEDGKPVRLTMGSYGVGVSRLVAVIAEQHHDELGLRWPASVTPFDVHLVIANKDDEARTGAGETGARPGSPRPRCAVRRPDRLARGEVQGRRTARGALDRRGRRGWADGVVELRNRFSGENREIAVDDAAAQIEASVRVTTPTSAPGSFLWQADQSPLNSTPDPAKPRGATKNSTPRTVHIRSRAPRRLARNRSCAPV